MSWMKDGREATPEEVAMMNEALSNPHHQWFEFWCGNCKKKICRMFIGRYLGGWMECWRCGYETLFSPTSQSGPCEQIQAWPKVSLNG